MVCKYCGKGKSDHEYCKDMDKQQCYFDYVEDIKQSRFGHWTGKIENESEVQDVRSSDARPRNFTRTCNRTGEGIY